MTVKPVIIILLCVLYSADYCSSCGAKEPGGAAKPPAAFTDDGSMKIEEHTCYHGGYVRDVEWTFGKYDPFMYQCCKMETDVEEIECKEATLPIAYDGDALRFNTFRMIKMMKLDWVNNWIITENVAPNFDDMTAAVKVCMYPRKSKTTYACAE